MSHKVRITDTTLRDGHQSLWATRMKTEDMLPILEKMDSVGFYSMEVWGGATFDSCLRYLNEDPWDRLDAIRKGVKNTKLQMLLRGQNILGYKHYPDDILTKFIQKAVEHGIDIIRIFDALNDVRNMSKAIEVTKKTGAIAEGTVVYTISPVHNIPHYIKTAKALVELGCDQICLKDMAGILKPYLAQELITKMKAELNVPIHLHTHFTSGMADMMHLKAIEAGVDIVDTAFSPLALGTSQPAVEPLVAVLEGTPYDTGLNLELLSEITDYFKGVAKKYPEFSSIQKNVDINVLMYQVPGGMLSNFRKQLSQQLDKLPAVLAEVPRVRKDLGYPPLVTPSSQMVGAQSVMNVLTGQRYKMVTNEVKNYLRGYYGRPPGTIDEAFRKSIIGDDEVISCRPAELLEPGFDKAKHAIAQYMEKEEDVLSYAAFPQVAEKFLQQRQAGKYKVEYETLEAHEKEGNPSVHPI